MDEKTKKLVTMAMLCAISYVVMYIGRFPLIPAVGFLTYDPKDVIIAIGGFLYGPLEAFLISLIVSLIEMITASDTELTGMMMNVLSTCSFACTASFIYKKMRTIRGAIIGLVSGCAVMAAVMLLWNYLITPIYLRQPRELIAEMLLPAFLPFNLIKGGLNAAITIFLYKPVVKALRAAGLVPESRGAGTTAKRTISVGAMILAAAILVTCVVTVLVFQGVI